MKKPMNVWSKNFLSNLAPGDTRIMRVTGRLGIGELKILFDFLKSVYVIKQTKLKKDEKNYCV